MLNKAYIDLNAIEENALKIKERLNHGVKFCAVVKADAYGHGAVEVASRLYNICDYFAVALVEEGISLRLGGIDKPIMVLIPPFDEDLERAIYYGLTLAVQDGQTIRKINDFCKGLGANAKVHVKVNTGMNRLGAEVGELDEILRVANRCKRVFIEGVFSHFGNPHDVKSLSLALDKFLLAKRVVKRYNNKVIAHVSASGGFLQGVQMDMVRIGIMLYGYKPFESGSISLRPAMKVTAPVVCKRNINKGDSALYGKCVSDEDLTVAITRFGYADGLFRKHTGCEFNNRCMDLTAIKSDENVECVIMENAEQTAKRYGTISYEILCGASRRAQKIYIR